MNNRFNPALLMASLINSMQEQVVTESTRTFGSGVYSRGGGRSPSRLQIKKQRNKAAHKLGRRSNRH